VAPTDSRDMAATTGSDRESDGQQRLDLTDSERTRQAPPA
jgi:hypothetical protein